MCSNNQMTFSQIQDYVNNEGNKDKEFIMQLDLSKDNRVREEEHDDR
ncbi:hypothetical protein SAMN02746066_01756 [Anaerosporobacter mobilis DSM 15930]|uniref:Uncharacterized protein n=1 Tax=Anaerosporobacter mobilis DSM 15930 TaxID=1120996 RepID=A0A1M7IB46_9FIRM|nr:hypothetical protein [Anaerosporobacter mobilis]SHM37667.1 hypothetical protein SAMN02746066_01756 [Anaerosporobacter mobilis DSM 15930]